MHSPWKDTLPKTENPVRFFLSMSTPHRRSALLAVLAVAAAAVLQALIPYVYKLITEGVMALSEGVSEPILFAAGAYFAIALSAHIFWRISGFAGSYWATGVRATSRAALYSYLSRHSYEYFSDRFAGSLLSKIKQAADGMRDLASAFLWEILPFLITICVSFYLVFSTSLEAGLILLAFFVLMIPFNWMLSRKRLPLSIAAQEAETTLNGATVDSIANIFSIHEYAKRGFEEDRLKALTLRRRTLGLKNWHFGEWLLFWNGVIVNIFMAALVFVSIYFAISGKITPGDITLLLATVWVLEGYFIHLGKQFDRLSEMWGQVSESLNDILVPHGVTDQGEAVELSVGQGAISFKGVSFKYENRPIFDGLSFEIQAGQRIGLVGKSGAGKTTLMKLMLRHYDLSGGTIAIDDTDISAVTKESLRNAIAVVPQEPALFHRTIHENIAYARPDASREEVIRAATLAQAHEFISALPEGYESLVGERGIKLSGGQRQRIAIARALLKDAPILLLDEATSALDSESEVLVQQALLALMQGRTVLAIAHRLSTLRAMDRLIVFDQGVIVEDGTHEKLVGAGGIYAELWNHQAGGFLADDTEAR